MPQRKKVAGQTYRYCYRKEIHSCRMAYYDRNVSRRFVEICELVQKLLVGDRQAGT